MKRLKMADDELQKLRERKQQEKMDRELSVLDQELLKYINLMKSQTDILIQLVHARNYKQMHEIMDNVDSLVGATRMVLDYGSTWNVTRSTED